MKDYLLLIFFTPIFLFAEWPLSGQENDKTESPYFQITSNTASTNAFSLLSTKADVKIAGVIADVTVTQQYQNNSKEPIEAVYIFPASTRAAVYDMEMIIGDRIIRAEIKEKKTARKMYETARNEGKRTSLLEQNRPNVFTMNVSNIQPSEIVEVKMKYTEDLLPENGEYSFIYPTVAGPRYTGEGSDKTVPDSDIFSSQGVLPSYQFDIIVDLEGGMAIQSVSSISHQINVNYENLTRAKVRLDQSEKFGGNRDFIMYYQLSGDQINTGLLVHETEDENFFMMTIQPPRVLVPKDVPRQEFIFVVDVSGSMFGFPLSVSKKLMRNLLTNLRDDDLFNVMLFAGTANTYAKSSISVTEANINSALNWIENAQGSGGTRLLNAMNKAIHLPNSSGDMARSIVIISDGYISVEKEVFDLIRNAQNEFNVYAFGIGSAPNRFLMEGIAHMGNTQSIIIQSEYEADEKADQFRQMIAHPILTNIKIDWGEFDVYDLEPSHINDVMAMSPIVVKGKYRGKPNGLIQVEGVSGRSKYASLVPISKNNINTYNPGLKYLWARKRIQLLDDYAGISSDKELKEEITNLGLKYNLLTQYTSFVAIDYEEVMAQDGTIVKQILPLPKGVSNRAISTQNNYAMGAELVISNSKNSLARNSTSIKITNTKLNTIQIEFFRKELESKLEIIRLMLKEHLIKGSTLQFKVNEDGMITNLLDPVFQIPEHVMKKIIQEMNTWRLKHSWGSTSKVNISLTIDSI